MNRDDVGAFNEIEPDRESIERQINARLNSVGGPKIATAESCTGGNLASRLTSVPGSSSYYLGGIVAYANEVKSKLLGVRRETLRAFGAVSIECAREMAEGARTATGADIAVSTTGIAGPDGGSASKPVGMVCIGLATPDECDAWSYHFVGDREDITNQATCAALELLLRSVISSSASE